MYVKGDAIYHLYVVPCYVHHRLSTAQWEIDFRRFSQHNLVYIYEGRGTFCCEGETREVKRGDLVYFPRGCARSMKTDPKALLKFYTVNFQAVSLTLSSDQGEAAYADFDFAFVKSLDDEALCQRFVALFEQLFQLFLLGEARGAARLRELMIEILALADYAQSDHRISCGRQDKIQRAMLYMAAHYREKITLKELAEAAALSPSHFSAVFREMTGRSPIDYLIQLRLSQAKLLLREGYTVSETAEAVGFSDIYYFSNTFRKAEGISPGRYQKLSRG